MKVVRTHYKSTLDSHARKNKTTRKKHQTRAKTKRKLNNQFRESIAVRIVYLPIHKSAHPGIEDI